MSAEYLNPGPTRAEIDGLSGLTVLQFGVDWCPHCKAAEPAIDQALSSRPDIKLIRVEDGKGRRLGRTFGVKLWPTLIFLKDGAELGRLVRPTQAEAINEELAKL